MRFIGQYGTASEVPSLHRKPRDEMPAQGEQNRTLVVGSSSGAASEHLGRFFTWERRPRPTAAAGISCEESIPRRFT